MCKKDYQKQYRENMSDEQKQKYKIIENNIEKIRLMKKGKK